MVEPSNLCFSRFREYQPQRGMKHLIATLEETFARWHMRRSQPGSFNRSRWPWTIYPRRTTAQTSRSDVCQILAAHNIASVLWLHDALVYYGSNTAVWDVHVLVDDIDEAVGYLKKAGYRIMPPSPQFEKFPEFSRRGRRMHRKGDECPIVLLRASEWHYQLPRDLSQHYPPLSAFLNSMLAIWLNISPAAYVTRLDYGLFIANLINYCYYLDDGRKGPVKHDDYAKYLSCEHCELHYDIVAANEKPRESFTATKRHNYHVHKYCEIKNGLFAPRPYGNNSFRPLLANVPET